MPNLDPIAEGIIPIDRVTALFVPRNFRGIRSPVVFLPVEPFKDRRVQLRCDAKIDVWSLDRARAALRDLIHSVQNHQLPCVWHGERNLCFTRHLSPFCQAERISVPGFSLLQIRHLDAHVADAAQSGTVFP